MAEANTLYTSYDGYRWSAQLDDRFSALFETEVRALWVPSGTAANCLPLAALCPPHGSVICHHDAHIVNDESGAPDFYTHGAKLRLAYGPGATLTPQSTTATLHGLRDHHHQAHPHPLYITTPTKYRPPPTPYPIPCLDP